jgi:death-on-curing protein
MNEPRWLTLDDIENIHAEQLALFGGPAGIRDRGALESALGRPINRWNYENADMAQLAAAYAFGIARNHPFVDGNKRTAFAALMVFLRLNGIPFAPPPPDATAAMMALAAGEIDEAGFARWIAANMPSA